MNFLQDGFGWITANFIAPHEGSNENANQRGCGVSIPIESNILRSFD
jgi:hypothetical protein